MPQQFQDIVIVTGHYGSGKTNLSLNLAMDFRRRGKEVDLADLDVVNPYFRTSDFREFAAANGIGLIASDYAGSSLDIPALTGRLDAALSGGRALIIDVGGDDAGAMALGRYAPRLEAGAYSMLYVLNAYRYLMRDPRESAGLLREIETASRLKATCLVNNSNLGLETNLKDVEETINYAGEVSGLTGLPVAFTAMEKALAVENSKIRDVYPVEIYVKAPWNEAL